ncbi:DUF6588 family protein [Yeosuana marina]|uniref:DUF6588 family protein n=1 Tax=Yeosuana marina TaxID=1565536 RepID=UPI0014214E75|nr:DUF6588 family protein [Yeosuana marina]
MKKITLLLFIFIVTQVSRAQDLGDIILAADDASKLTENYIRPVMNGLMYSMNGGWYTTAKTHKKFGFDLTIEANGSFVPKADEVFQFIQSDYTYSTLPNGETSLPTVISSDETETTIDVRVPYNGNTYKVASFNMPGGVGGDLPGNIVPAPMVQLGFGLPFHTDIKVRYVPTLNFNNDVEANLIGVGLQHDLMHYFGPLDKLPLNVSVLAAFTTMDVTYNINDDNPNDEITITNGKGAFKMNTWTLQALGSLDFPIITLYAGVGYNHGKSSLKIKGDYDITYDVEDSNGNTVGTANESVTDPVNLNFDANGVRTTLGARLNLGIFKIFGDYTLQKYNTVSAGIAFSFR